MVNSVYLYPERVPANLWLRPSLALKGKMVPKVDLFEDARVMLLKPVHGWLSDDMLSGSENQVTELYPWAESTLKPHLNRWDLFWKTCNCLLTSVESTPVSIQSLLQIRYINSLWNNQEVHKRNPENLTIYPKREYNRSKDKHRHLFISNANEQCPTSSEGVHNPRVAIYIELLAGTKATVPEAGLRNDNQTTIRSQLEESLICTRNRDNSIVEMLWLEECMYSIIGCIKAQFVAKTS